MTPAERLSECTALSEYKGVGGDIMTPPERLSKSSML